MLNGILYVLRTGCAWRELPHDLPPWDTVYGYFRRWTKEGLWEWIGERLRDQARPRAAKKKRPTAAILDSQSVKTAGQGGPCGYDANKKIKGRKRHLLTDTLGWLLGVEITAASVQDRDGAKPLLRRAKLAFGRLSKVWADSGYAGKFVHLGQATAPARQTASGDRPQPQARQRLCRPAPPLGHRAQLRLADQMQTPGQRLRTSAHPLRRLHPSRIYRPHAPLPHSLMDTFSTCLSHNPFHA